MRQDKEKCGSQTRRDYYKACCFSLLVDFVKGSGVVETAIPDFVDDSGSVGLVFAAGPVGD